MLKLTPKICKSETNKHKETFGLDEHILAQSI